MTLSVGIAIFAVVVSALSVVYSRRMASSAKDSAAAADRSAVASERSAQAAEAADRRERKPQLVLTVPVRAQEHDELVICELRNLGPQDLDSVVVNKPLTDDGISYPVARTGDGFGLGEAADLGAVPLGERGRLTLSLGPSYKLPTFRMRVACRAGQDEWEVLVELPRPRVFATSVC